MYTLELYDSGLYAIENLDKTDVVVMIYSVTDMASYDELLPLIIKVRCVKPNIPIVLVANKLDLVESRVVTNEMGIYIATTLKLSAYIETSAKTSINIRKVYPTAVSVFNRECCAPSIKQKKKKNLFLSGLALRKTLVGN